MKKDACEKLIKEIRHKIATRHPDFIEYEKASMVDKLIEDGVQYNRIRLTYRQEPAKTAEVKEVQLHSKNESKEAPKETPKEQTEPNTTQIELQFDENGFYVPENEEEVKEEIYNKAKYGMFGTVRAFIRLKPEDITIKFHKFATNDKDVYYSVIERLILLNMTMDEKGKIYYHATNRKKYTVAWFDIKNRAYKKVEDGRLVEIDAENLWAELRSLGKQVDEELKRVA